MHILEMDATDLAARVRSGELGPLDIVDAAIGACERLNPTLNAVFSTRFERAREEAYAAGRPPGALAGIPPCSRISGRRRRESRSTSATAS